MLPKPLLLLILSLSVLSILIAPASSISISCTTGGGGNVAASSMSFTLDDSTSLNSLTVLNSGSISQSSEASGLGQNAITQQVSRKGSSADNTILSNGAFIASTSAAASPESASINQQVVGIGDVSLSLKGTGDQVSADQEACVIGGVLSSSQSVSAGDGVTASQSTNMAGLMGYVGSGAFSSDEAMVANGNFLGDGTLTAELSSTTVGEAKLNGDVATDGVTWMSNEDLQEVSQNGGGISMQGLRAISDGMGTFEMNAVSLDAEDLDSMGQVAIQAQGGSSSSYMLTGWRWNTLNPKIQLYVKDDNNGLIPGTGLTATQAQTAIANAANTWDDAVAQNLFADGNTVVIDPNKNIDNPYDGYNVLAWKYLSDAPTALAYTRTRYDTPIVNGYWTAYESDVSFNTVYPWSTAGVDGTPYHLGDSMDVQSVALHELGHTIGLGDLYTLPAGDARKSDWSQIMNSYNDVQRTLGSGDIAAVMLLYPSILGKVTLVSPSGTITTSTPTYVWDNIDESTMYHLWVGTSSSQVLNQWYNKADVINGDVCQVTPSISLANGQYQWCIQTWNPSGYGPWSDENSIKVQSIIPGIPDKVTLVSPFGSVATSTPTYIWNNLDGSTMYHLWVGTSSSQVLNQWYNKADVINGDVCQVTPSIALANGQYQWCIQTWSPLGYGPWSDESSINVQTTTSGSGTSGTPGKATLVSPFGTIATSTPTYIWNNLDGSTMYHLWIGTSSGQALNQWYNKADVINGDVCQVTPSISLANGQYEWCIQTWSPLGYGPWSDESSINVQTTTSGSGTSGTPGKVTLVSPSGTITTSTPTYSWNNIDGSTMYHLWIGTSSSQVFNQWYNKADVINGDVCQVTPSISLANGQYEWCIQTWSPLGYGPWSDENSIKVSI